jgi:moderate conductance mechanosensitive channel
VFVYLDETMLEMLRILTIVALFAAAWLVSRCAAFVARTLLAWHDRHTEAAAASVELRIANVKRRETTVAVIRAAIAYAAFAIALVLSAAQLTGGLDKLSTLAGASFVIILAGFAVQRVLMDVIAGTMMFVEGWYQVGDTIAIPTLELQGVVEDMSLRRTKLRTLEGETIQVSNSQIPAVRVLPAGLKELAMELFVSDRESGTRLAQSLQTILPEGPTTFARRPWIEEINELDERLVRIRLRASVAPGREWLVDGFFSDLLKERADDGLIVHGPVVLTLDEQAARSFARASAAMRWRPRPALEPEPTS